MLRLLNATKKSRKSDHLRLGEEGEKIAKNFLYSKGYQIIEQNYGGKGGEVDLIAIKGRELHFIEVKSRRSTQAGSPEEAVHYHKRRLLSRQAVRYAMTHEEYENYEKLFSVVSISWIDGKPSIEFFPNAFELEGDYY
ncbi:MAG: hypothetical protein A2048_01990 [Deltaproteobacteria bacterium GWA2_45_12]|nr:MAG: hypothetical protein A2048_01990 [Deltaproteobacteria bacterium GWA2_45_12]